jgi:hypothetical protein
MEERSSCYLSAFEGDLSSFSGEIGARRGSIIKGFQNFFLSRRRYRRH